MEWINAPEIRDKWLAVVCTGSLYFVRALISVDLQRLFAVWVGNAKYFIKTFHLNHIIVDFWGAKP